MVIMADGTVRFLSEKTSDEVFKALATIKGEEPKINLEKTAPKVAPPAEDDTDTKAQANPPADQR
jgi:hypothetical protein